MITQRELKRLFDYDELTGLFRAKVKRSRNSKNAGEVVGLRSDGTNGSISYQNKLYKLSHLAWLYVHGTLPDGQIDHINLDTADCRISNLREATQNQNKANCGVYRNNALGLKNIRFKKTARTYQVRCTKDHKTYYGGDFHCLGRALKTARSMRNNIHHEFANHG